MKFILYGDAGKHELLARHCFGQQSDSAALLENEPVPELVAQLAQEIYANDVLLHLSVDMAKLEFEARKDACQIFNNLLRRQIGSRSPTVEYLCTRNNVLLTLMNG